MRAAGETITKVTTKAIRWAERGRVREIDCAEANTIGRKAQKCRIC